MAARINEMTQNPDLDNLHQPDAYLVQKKPLPMTKPADNVDRIKHLMRKYSKFTDEDLLKEIMKEGDPNDVREIRILCTMHYFQQVLRQAVTEIKLEDELNGLTYIDKFIQECPSPPDVMTVEETAQLYIQWCQYQNIDPGDLLMKKYAVLGKVYPKRNCLMLQGQSNAGKTFWTVPLMPFADCIGQTIPSQDFAFMKCVNKDLIQIPELTLSKPEQVEEFKKVAEGLPTSVNVKHKDPRILERTPVVLTCNETPWKFFNQEQQALQTGCSPSPTLLQQVYWKDVRVRTPNSIKWCSNLSRMRLPLLPNSLAHQKTRTCGSCIQT